MTNKYRFKNKSLENALVVLYGEDFVEDQVNRQMANNTSFICFELDEANGFSSSTTISKGEIAETKEYKPNFGIHSQTFYRLRVVITWFTCAAIKKITFQ